MDKDRIRAKLEKRTVYTGDCWLYKDNSGLNRYINISIDGEKYGVHRLSAYIFHGLDLDNNELQANHKEECMHRACWNPSHLYIGNQKENLRDRFKLITHCPRGHEYSENNTRIHKGRRYCRECNRLKAVANWKKKCLIR